MKIVKNKNYTYELDNETKTIELGKKIGASVEKGTLITIDGDLGAGKTILTKGIASSIGVKPSDVSSPTYVIMKPYITGYMPLYHWDFYRLESIEELYIADFFELLHEKKYLIIIEWASLFKSAWIDHFPRIEITIQKGAEHDKRTITLISKG